MKSARNRSSSTLVGYRETAHREGSVLSPYGTSWHYRTEPSFPNSEVTPVGCKIPGTASEAGGRAFESRPGHHFFQLLTDRLLGLASPFVPASSPFCSMAGIAVNERSGSNWGRTLATCGTPRPISASSSRKYSRLPATCRPRHLLCSEISPSAAPTQPLWD